VQEDPAFQPNRNFARDTTNVLVGIVWQLCLTALPIYLVLQYWSWVGAILAVLVVTTVIIKFNWYDKLEKA
jgi:fatty acid desaturase